MKKFNDNNDINILIALCIKAFFQFISDLPLSSTDLAATNGEIKNKVNCIKEFLITSTKIAPNIIKHIQATTIFLIKINPTGKELGIDLAKNCLNSNGAN